MESKFWHERWEKNEIGFHQEDINLNLRDYWSRLQVPKNQLIFVPLCGKSRDMLWLVDQGYRVMGIELSEIAVRDFFAENELTPQQTTQDKFTVWSDEELQIFCGDVFDLTPAATTPVKAVYDRACLVAFPEPMRQRYAQRLVSLLSTGTTMLLVTLEYPEEQREGPPFSVSPKEVNRLFADHFALKQLAKKDILDENPRLKAQGLTEFWESVYLLQRV